MEVFKNEREKKISIIVFGIYILLLCWLVLFKFAISIADIPNIRGLNLIPFHYDLENSFHTKEVLLNIVAFIPFGCYFTAFTHNTNRFIGIVGALVVSTLFETIQWIFSIGASDITDIITNTIGGILGFILFTIIGQINEKRRMKIFNTIGIVIESFAIILLIAINL